MKRLFDILLAILFLLIASLPMLLVVVSVSLTSKGPVLYWSDRVGKDNVLFRMPKFRTMKVDTPVIATHLMKNPEIFVSSIGHFLRRTSIDELPQVFSILKGDMSFVGPRPALNNQDDLIALRKEKKVDVLVPGITGWAQVNGRDYLSINEKVELDVEYLQRKSFWFDLKILWITFLKVIKRDSVSH
jgi:O-antigen biosynthesis protein WbqP